MQVLVEDSEKNFRVSELVVQYDRLSPVPKLMLTKDTEDKLSIQVMSGDESYEYRVNLTQFSIAISVNNDEPLITINPHGLGLFYSNNL